MREILKDKFNLAFFLLCFISFIIVVLRCIRVPIAHDEVATFYYYVQSETFLPFRSHVDANGHFLNSFLCWVSYKCFGSSALALRLPCIFAFIILCIGVFKINTLFSGIASKIIVTSAFILSFNILNFYSLARGYGLSISFLVLSFYYFFIYLKNFSLSQFAKFVLFSQIALSANLTLVFTLLVATAIVIFFQLRTKVLFSLKNILLLLAHLGLIFFWVKYAFYLQENGALYYGGSGEGYLKVTFVSLIETVFLQSKFINYLLLFIFLSLFGFWCLQLLKKKLPFLIESYFGISFLMLGSLIAAFYVLNKLFGVNYPEDRTGIFFYILFILAIAFLVDELKVKFITVSSLVLPAFFAIQLAVTVNTDKHSWKFYETMPPDFYQTLTNEQLQSKEPISIGGHRVLEFFFSFYNYNSPTKLSHMAPPEQMCMNCDYYVTWKKDKPYYDKYYHEISVAKHWDMVLLKRKVKAKRVLIYETKTPLDINGSEEYYKVFEKLDTVFTSEDPVMAEFDVNVINSPTPFNAWLVLQIDSEHGTEYFRRTPFNWVKLDWNVTEHFKTLIVTDNVPLKKSRLVAFLWNIDKKPIQVRINSLKLYRLQGEGVSEVSQAKN
jgi:hypothetical protein